MTIECNRCGCLMLGPYLDREHAELTYACMCCPHVVHLEASAIDIARHSNVIPIRERRAAARS